ncbi:MAG: polysaccharide biosynthesis tyrosine autokinase [Gemmatimonadaceae bacterium]
MPFLELPRPAGAPNAPSAPPTPGMTDVGRIVAAVRARPLVVVVAALLCAGAAAYLARRAEAVYRATAVIRLGEGRRSLTSGLEEDERLFSERLTSPLLSQIQLVRSRSAIGRVVDTLGLRLWTDLSAADAPLVSGVRVAPDAPADSLRLRFGSKNVTVRGQADSVRVPYGTPVRVGGVEFTVASRPSVPQGLWWVLNREESVDRVLATLKVAPRVSTNVVDVSYRAFTPELAQAVVNAVVEVFRDQSAQSAQQLSRRRRLFLEEQLGQADSVLAEAQLELSAFRRTTQAFSSRDRITAQQRDLGDLDLRRGELAAERRMFQGLLARVRGAGPDRFNAEIRTLMAALPTADPVLGPLYERLSRQQAARDSLTTGPWRRSERDPDLRRLDTLITEGRAELAAAAASRVAALTAREGALDEQRARGAAAMDTLPQLEAREVRLAQRVETIRRTADALREEHQRARIAEAVEVGEAEIVDLAQLPYEPEKQFVGLEVILGLVLGLGLGTGGAVLLDRRDTSIRRGHELEDLLRVPSLGAIPRVELRGAARGLRATRALRRLPPWRDEAAEGRHLVTLAPIASHGSEAYRVVRTNLRFSGDAEQLRTLVVTSAAPSEGKTLTAANLAVTFAREGRRVLLVDCDVRRARLHDLFGVPRRPGLSELVRDPAARPAAAAIRATSVPGLHLLPAGVADAHASEPLAADGVFRLLGSLADEYDLLLLDAPPVLAMADALALAGLADGVLLVVRAGHTERAAAQDALHRLAAVRAHVIGAVLTDSEEPAYREYYMAYAGAVHD